MNKHMKIFLVALVVVLAGTVGFALAQTMVVPVAQDPNAAAAEMAKDAAAAAGEELTPFSEAWFKKTKEPVPWFKWGADIRTRDEYTNNLQPVSGLPLNKHSKGHEFNYGRFRERIWATITPVKDIDLFMRFTNEFRVYSEPDKNNLRDVDFSEVVFDNLYVKYRNAFGLPVTFTIGRQDILLGDGWLVNEGGPKDGSRTAYFDAIRATTEFKDANTTVDTIYLQDYANAEATWLPPMNPREWALMEQNERGAILYVTNKSIKDTEINPYFIYKQDRNAHMEGVTFGGPADIYTFGVRVAHDFDKHWRARAEIAKQLGHKNYEDLCALGFNSRLSYFVND